MRGRACECAIARPDPSLRPRTSTSYAYDVASRLTNINHIGPSGIIEALTYAYDPAGNRTSLTRNNAAASLLPAAVASATYDPANEQTAFAGQLLEYDANGNLSKEKDGTGTVLRQYTWDARNRLVGISGNATAEFKYDPLGRRTSKTINSVVSQFAYDGNDITSEIGGGAVGASYLRSLNIDEPFIRQTGTGNEHYHTDALGSSLALSNLFGATATTYTYEPFGKTAAAGTSTNAVQYTGRENDGTGLYYYRARYYSPRIERFLNEDPLRFGGGDINIFAYAQNSPVNLSDPSGLVSSGTPIPPGCQPPLDKREKYFDRMTHELLCSLDFLPVVAGVNVTGKALKHVMGKHFPGATAEGGSIFAQGEKIADLLQKAESVAPVIQPNGNFQRVVNAGRNVGTDVTTGQPTSIYTVITDAANNLVTMHPGGPRISR